MREEIFPQVFSLVFKILAVESELESVKRGNGNGGYDKGYFNKNTLNKIGPFKRHSRKLQPGSGEKGDVDCLECSSSLPAPCFCYGKIIMPVSDSSIGNPLPLFIHKYIQKIIVSFASLSRS